MIQNMTVYVSADSAPQALNKALDKLELFAARTGQVASIENYTMKQVGENRFRIDFE